MFGEAAIEAYRAIGDQVGTVAATARFARVLIDASELDRAKATLEAIVPAAEELDDPSALAAALANLTRACMRLAETGPAIEAADMGPRSPSASTSSRSSPGAGQQGMR